MRKNKLLIWLLVIVAMVGLTACMTQSYTVTFDTNDGSAVESIVVDANGTITAPANPTKEGYTFAGWYLDAEFTQEVDFATYKFQDNITLYAKWEASSYTVNFEINGGTGTAAPQTVKHGERVQMPTGLTKEGYKLKNWYKDSALTIPFVPTAGVTSDLTLYAKWESLLTFSGTNSGNATYDAETGTYSFTTTLGLFGRFMVAYNGALLSADPEGDLIITGAFTSENAAGWDENLYCDVPDGADPGTPIDYTTFICSSSRSVNYTVTYDPATNVLDIQAEFVPDVYEVSEEGLFFLIRDNNRLLSSYGDATLNDDGSYTTTIELSRWWRVYLWFDGVEIDVNGVAADIKGDFGTWSGRENPKDLYSDLENDGPCAFISSFDGTIEHKITYYPATDTTKAYVVFDADPINEPYDPSQEDVIKTTFAVDNASDTALAVWTEANTVFRDTETGSYGPMPHGWRLIAIVDADGKLAYFVINIDNGYGTGDGYYAHPDYATNNPAYSVTDNGWKLVLPEGGFAVTGHSEKALKLILALTGDEYATSEDAEKVVNKMGAISADARIAYDSANGTITVSGVSYEKEEVNPDAPVKMTVGGTFEQTIEAVDGVYTLEATFATWNRFSLTLGETAITTENTTITGLFVNQADAPWDNRFYTEDGCTFLYSMSAPTTYIITYTVATNTLDIAEKAAAPVLEGTMVVSGTFPQNIEAVDGVYTLEATFATWNRFSLTIGETAITTENTTITGLFVNQADAPWDNRFYTEDGCTFIYSMSTPTTYIITYTAATNTLDIAEKPADATQGLVYVHSVLGEVAWEANAEGKYEVTLDFAIWNSIKVSFNGIFLTDASVTGDFAIGAGDGTTLYVDKAGDSSFFCNKASKFKLTFDVETGKLNVEHIEFI